MSTERSPEMERLAGVLDSVASRVRSAAVADLFHADDEDEEAAADELSDEADDIRDAARALREGQEAEIDARERSAALAWLERELADNEGSAIHVPYQYAVAFRAALRSLPEDAHAGRESIAVGLEELRAGLRALRDCSDIGAITEGDDDGLLTQAIAALRCTSNR